MKKYFVKQLPRPIPEGYNNPHVDYWDGQNPNALYLCSRDIGVGDECYHKDYHEMGAWAMRGESIEDCVDWHGENVDISKLFKVIGEISPTATWVTEGMEFEEGEVALGMGRNEYVLSDVSTKPHSDRKWYIPESNWPDCVIKIKCPTCQTFH